MKLTGGGVAPGSIDSVARMNDELDPLEVAVRLMQVDSTSGREGSVMLLVEDLLRGRGWHTSRIAVSEGRFNVYAVRGEGAGVTLSTHLDTVPPYIPPRVEGNTLHGRGACDAKGIAAAMICAAEALAVAGAPVGVLFVVGEEVSHDGAHAANAFPNRSIALVNGEPTGNTLALGTKGAVRIIMRTRGVEAHSAYPELGDSAIMRLAALLTELNTLPLPRNGVFGETTINVGMISGGVADNVIPPWAEARLMARLVGPKEEVVELLRDWVGDRAELEVGVAVPVVELGTLPGFRTSVVSYATDIPALTNWGTPYLFGPGSIHLAHRPDERITRGELTEAVAAYVRLVQSILAEAAPEGDLH